MRLLEIVLMNLGGLWQGIRQDWNPFEIAVVAIGILAWRRGWRPRRLRLSIVKRPWMAAAAIILGALAIRLALLPLLHHPAPVVTDEFSHLLLADTLAHGRLANPPHPFWQHFESIHILQQPRYVSNYFPGPAATLAAAMVLVHDPWAGVLGQFVLFLAALYWMLRGWMPPRWALFGILLAALRFGIGSYWMNSYYGGFFAAAGGALVAGAFPRLWRSASARIAALLGCGLAILVFTRPFEGFFFSLPWTAALVWRYRASGWAIGAMAAPVAILVGAAIAAMGVYLKAATGSPLLTPYQISERTYGWPLGMPWAPLRPDLHFRHVEMAQYYQYELGEREKIAGPVNLLEYFVWHLETYWRFFIGPFLVIPLLMIPRVWRRRKMLFAGAAGAILACLIEGASMPHYLAPATAVLIAIVVEGCRHLRASRVHIAHWLPAAMGLVLALRIGAGALGLPYTQKLNYQSWCCVVEGNANKTRISAALRKIPGGHLVFVKPKTDPYNLLQWIYNSADIDSAPIVWARDMGAASNEELAKYFAGRRVWLVDPNVNPASCEPYPIGQRAAQ